MVQFNRQAFGPAVRGRLDVMYHSNPRGLWISSVVNITAAHHSV